MIWSMRLLFRIIKFFNKSLNFIYNWMLFKAMHVKYSGFPIIQGRMHLRNSGNLIIGSGVRINSDFTVVPVGGWGMTSFSVHTGGYLCISDGVGITNSVICCAARIEIKQNVFIGSGCRIYDTDFHSIKLENRILHEFDPGIKTSPVKIGNGVFIGAGCIILKGVEIGARSVIGAGSVVSKSIPSGEIWAGNPATFIRKLRSDEV